MDVLKVVILAKYAQGLIPFQGCYDLIFSLNPSKRNLFFGDLERMIFNLGLSQNDVEKYVKEPGLSDAQDVVSVARDAPAEILVKKLVSGIETNRKEFLHAILGLFTMAYLRRYSRYKGDPAKFWYWDFKNYSNTEKLNSRVWETIDLSKFN
jgi:hypothetical protein